MDGFRKAQDQGGMQGVFSFGYFSLDKQRKVSRLSVCEPTSKIGFAKRFIFKTPQFESYPGTIGPRE